MKLKRIGPSMLGLLLATSFNGNAQEQAVKEAAATVEPAIQLAFSVTGLTRDNVTKVKESLQTLTHQVYACEKCKFEQATPGKCAPCNVDLVARKHPLFQGVTPSAEDSTVKLTLDPATAVRFSELEKTLEKNAVKIDAARFPIPGKAHLVFRGGTADAATAIEKSLKDAKLFDEIKASFDADTSEVRVMVRAGAVPPTRAKLLSSLESAGVKIQLADVVWGHKKVAG